MTYYYYRKTGILKLFQLECPAMTDYGYGCILIDGAEDITPGW